MHTPFDVFLSQLAETNATLSFFTDFNKVKQNTDRIAISLHQLNYLLGQEDLPQAVTNLFQENPNVFKVLPILIAVRENSYTKVVNELGEIILISDYFNTPEGIVKYLQETGLSEVFINKEITNLVDYVFGIEVGLDTNARKNRSGYIMVKTIAKILDTQNIPYQIEVSSEKIAEMPSLGVDTKTFDFVIDTPQKKYLIEVNFYNGGGSKLNEVARAYIELASKINQDEGFEFVWITDGQGWHSAKSKLEEAYNNIPSVYNLSNLHLFIERVKNGTSIQENN